MGRPALQVRVRIQDTDIDLIASHFKSKLLTFPPDRFSPHDEASAPCSVPTRSIAGRRAVTVRAAATDLLTSDHEVSVMVLGDLNDEVEAATTQILNGPTGSEIGTAGFNQPDHGDRQRLSNLAHTSPQPNASAAKSGRDELSTTSSSVMRSSEVAQDHVTTRPRRDPLIDDDPTQRRGAPGLTTDRS